MAQDNQNTTIVSSATTTQNVSVDDLFDLADQTEIAGAQDEQQTEDLVEMLESMNEDQLVVTQEPVQQPVMDLSQKVIHQEQVEPTTQITSNQTAPGQNEDAVPVQIQVSDLASTNLTQ